MAKLIESLAFAGSRLTDGTPNASGKVWVYVRGTSTLAPVYSDAEGDAVLTQPVVLDGAGKVAIYIAQPVTILVETAASAPLQTTELADAPGAILVQNDAFTGTLPSGQQGVGGETDLDTVLSSSQASFGGTDFMFRESAGGSQRTVASWMREVHISIRDFGAVGNGVVDDTTACQNAINRVAALGGGTLFFPPGTYAIAGAVTNSSTASVSFEGVGSASVLKNTSAGNSLIVLNNAAMSGVTISRLAITATGSSAPAILAIGVSNLVVSDVVILNHVDGISMSGTYSGVDIVRTTISTAAGGDVGVLISGAAHQVTISSSRITSTTAISASTSTTLANLNIWGNYISSTTALSIPSSGVTTPVLYYGNDSTGTISQTGSTGWFRQWGNGIDGASPQVMANNGTVTPDFSKGPELLINVTGSGKTIGVALPNLTPAYRGATFLLKLWNNNGGVTTWSTDAGYRLSATISTSAGNITELTVLWDIDRTLWVEIGRALTI